MKTLFTVVLLSAGLMSGVAHAADPTAQQSKMTSCNKDAGDKKGDDRKAFMKACLSAKPAAADAAASKALTPQQQKMKDCNADAKTQGKTGADRKAFMSQCLKKQ